MSLPLVQAENLSKVYRLYDTPWQRLLEMVSGRPRHRAIAALENVSFSLEPGQSLGIIGENGAGKSTLLKLLSGVTAPSSGKLRVEGRVASLLELGMGFHPELSGRQNIRLTAAIMGFGADEVAEKTPEIIAFSELGDFIDRPIKTYSSGMAMRLGFAIAAQVEPEVLIIDEALSVGDGYFQKKCMDRIRALLDDGCTFLFCSHAMYYVSTFCDRALWLERGQARALGDVAAVVREYESHLLKRRHRAEIEEEAAVSTPTEPVAHNPARLISARLLDGEVDGTFCQGSSWGLEVEWQSEQPELVFQVGVGINRGDGVQVCSFLTTKSAFEPLTGQEHYRVRLHVPSLPIHRGEFEIYVFLADEVGLHVYDQIHMPDAFVVDSDDYDYGMIQVDHYWQRSSAQESAPASSRSAERRASSSKPATPLAQRVESTAGSTRPASPNEMEKAPAASVRA